ncbi:MAG: lipopolysaccharide heptosyltransferase II [Burkholderiales bacterium]|nr:lipopolysaccharide heptosyltransferase II [Burkholderiales bacterium]
MPKYLIVAPSWVGDTVLAQPLLRRLLERNPGSTIDVLASPAVAPVLTRMAEVSAVIDHSFGHGELRLADRWRSARNIKQGGYDHAIVLPNSFKSALLPFFAGIAKRTGYVGEARYGLLNDIRKLDEAGYPLMVERYALLAEAAGAPLQRPLPEPRLLVDETARQATMNRLKVNSAGSPIVAFCPGAEYGPAKRWPAEHFAALATSYLDNGDQVWLLGSSNDAQIAAEINRLCGNACRDFTGKTGLAEVIDLLSCAARVVSNDSGLMHIAAALDRPMAALYGSSSPLHTPPLSARARVVYLHLDCSPCYQRHCPLGHFNCMRQMQPELVRRTLEEVPIGSATASASDISAFSGKRVI